MFPSSPVFAPFLVAFAVLAAPAAHALPVVKTEHVEAQLVADRSAAQPGKPVLVGLRLRMEPQWHTYWRNPGDSGLPTRIQWLLPEGWKAGEIQWPYPQLLPVGPLMNYGYEDAVLLLAELTPPASATAGTFPIKAPAEWLSFQAICISQKGELGMTLPVSAAPPSIEPPLQARAEHAR